MNKLRRPAIKPENLDWHLRFCGHVDEVNQEKFEDCFLIKMGLLNPILLEKDEPDDDEVVLDIFLEWNSSLNQDLLEMKMFGFNLILNEREGNPCQENT